MTDASRTPDPGRPDRGTPPRDGGERRLARPPSERYGSGDRAAHPADAATAAPSAATDPGSPARAIAYGAIAAIVGGAVIVGLGGVMAISAGLLVAAAAIGYVVGLAILAGTGGTLTTPARPAIAAGLAGLGILLGQVGLWLFARTEGGVLPLFDYLGETFGALVPLELLLAVGGAWWRAR